MATAFDEMKGTDGVVRPAYGELSRWLDEVPADVLDYRRREAEILFRRIGITFAVYGAADATERLIPFDIVPRVISGAEWRLVERGLIQRVQALNVFLGPLWRRSECLRAGVVPDELMFRNPAFRLEMSGRACPRDVYVHIAASTWCASAADEFYVLEDNVRTPSGVSYMLENREVMMRLFPELFPRHAVLPVEHYTEELLRRCARVASFSGDAEPTVVLLTPGHYNSAYFEHAFLADEMGIELVEGTDLFVDDCRVYMRTTRGPKRVDVIYRRVDDAFLDPLAFKPGLAAGRRRLVSADPRRPGQHRQRAGQRRGRRQVDLSLRAGDDPLLPGRGADPEQRADLARRRGGRPEIRAGATWPSWWSRRSMARAARACWSGRPRPRARSRSSARMLEGDAGELHRPADPRRFRTCPTFVDRGVAPRHVDLRPFVLTGREVAIIPGGLTRVALKDGSLVVNSSQGGGTKDTWGPGGRPDLAHAQQHRQEPLLDGALYPARREHRARSRGHASPALPPGHRGRPVDWPPRWAAVYSGAYTKRHGAIDPRLAAASWPSTGAFRLL